MTFQVRVEQLKKENLFGHHTHHRNFCFKNKLIYFPLKTKSGPNDCVIPLLGFLYRNSPLIIFKYIFNL